MLLTNGTIPEPGASDSEVEALVGVVPGLLNVKVQGPVKLVGLLFPDAVQLVLHIASVPEKKFGKSGLGRKPIVLVGIGLPVARLVVVAVPVVPLGITPLGVTLVAPYQI